MSSYNKVILLGNLTRDIELRQILGGNAVANIGLAVNRKYKAKSGEWKEETTYIDCEAWGKSAETMAKYLAKGNSVLIEGRLKLDQWQDKDGTNRSKLKVMVENFQFTSKPGNAGARQPQRVASGVDTSQGTLTDDDIPF